MSIDPHPLLDARVFSALHPAPLGEIETPAVILELLELTPGSARVKGAPDPADDAGRKAVRDLLRHGGYKPTGRGKPASEYLLGAHGAGSLAPINFSVDVCNAVSLHSGLPISVIDVELAREPFSIAVASAGASYAFNASGQTIALEGLLCLFDADGPCANAVKDSLRTKTRAATRATLSVVWGSRALSERSAQTLAWYRALLESSGVTTELVV